MDNDYHLSFFDEDTTTEIMGAITYVLAMYDLVDESHLHEAVAQLFEGYEAVRIDVFREKGC